MCLLLLVGMAHAFGSVVHVQRSVSKEIEESRQMAKRSSKRVRGSMGMVVSQDSHALSLPGSHCSSLVIINLTTNFMGWWLHFGSLSSLPFLLQSPSSFFLTLVTIFYHTAS